MTHAAQQARKFWTLYSEATDADERGYFLRQWSFWNARRDGGIHQF